MKKLALLLLLVPFALLAAPDDKTVTLTGEVVDLHCYTSRGAHGEEHAGCANACISRDVPAGFLTEDGTLYLLVNEKKNTVKEKVARKPGKKLTATGRVVERSGMKVLQLMTLE